MDPENTLAAKTINITTQVFNPAIFEPVTLNNSNYPAHKSFYGLGIPLVNLPHEFAEEPDVKFRVDKALSEGHDRFYIRSSLAPTITLRHPAVSLEADYRELEESLRIMRLRNLSPNLLLDGRTIEIRISFVKLPDDFKQRRDMRSFLAVDEVIFPVSEMVRAYDAKRP